MRKGNISFSRFLKQWLFLKWKSMQLSMAIKLCDMKQQAFNRRYYVVIDSNDKLVSLSREDVNRLKRQRIIDKRVTHLDLEQKSFYYTPLCRNEKSDLTKEERIKRYDNYMKYVKYKNKFR